MTMKTLILVILTATIVTGCADIDDGSGWEKARQLDPELTQYFKYYTEATYDDHLDSHHVKFASLESNQYGVCRKHTSAIRVWKEVLINPDRWSYLSEIQRKTLMLHEFGHCEGDQLHTNEYYHIMYPHLQGHSFLTNNWVEVYENSYAKSPVYIFAIPSDMEHIEHK